MRGSWRRFAVVGLMTFIAGVALVPWTASSDDCQYGHACSENDKDGRGCCPAPKVDAKQAAAVKQAAEAKKAADARKAAEAKRAEDARKAAEAKEAAEAKQAEEAKKAADASKSILVKQAEEDKAAADAKKPSDAVKAATPAKLPATTSGCPGDMVHVPAGTFMMGSPAVVGDDDGDEHPQHQVTLSGYCIDRTEVTVAAYGHCVASGKCTAASEPAKIGFDSLCNGTRADRQDHPVNCVDWNQATAYCAWANKRLPSEAEWEYAARGRDGRTYPWGNEAPSAKRLNACGIECFSLGKRLGFKWWAMYADSDAWEATAPVGSFPSGASPFGALDMAGNVWEWTADRYGDYKADASTNPRGPKDGTARVIRGGGWFDNTPAWVCGEIRIGYVPDASSSTQGLRCARGD